MSYLYRGQDIRPCDFKRLCDRAMPNSLYEGKIREK